MTYPILDPAAGAEPPQPGVDLGACALAMMIKAPRPGASKTRLSPPLTPEEAAALSGCFLRDTTAHIALVAAAGVTHTDGEPDGAAMPAAGIAVYTPTGMESAFDGLLPEGFCMVAQRDGGYYLIGVKKAHRRLFEDITWSTEHVARETLERAAEIGLEMIQLPTWYDVDDAATLRALCDELFAGARGDGYEAPRTRAFLAGLIEREGRARIWPQ